MSPTPARLVPAAPAWLAAVPLVWLLAAAPAPAAEELVDGIAAQVGNDIVLISEVRQLAGPAAERMRAAGAPASEIAKLRADVLESLVERALIRQVVRRSELDASEEEVDAAVTAIAKENGLRFDQLQASVQAQGLSFQAYRERIRGEIEHQKVLNGMVASRVRVDDAEVLAAFEEEFSEQPQGGGEVHLRHLLVPIRSKKPAEKRAACQQARAALARIRGGEPFAQVAAEVSPVNPRQGGDIGWLHDSELASWMAPAVAELGPGATSDVIETAFGCNLLQVVESRSFEPFTFEDVRDPLTQRIFQEKLRAEYAQFIEKLRGQTYIERKGFFADAARLGGDAPAAPGGAAP